MRVKIHYSPRRTGVLCLVSGLLMTAARLALGDDARGSYLLTNEHVDLKVILAPEGTNLLQLVFRDHLQSVDRPTRETVVRVPETARLTIPEGFEAVGPAGSDLWVLPAGQDPRLLYLGFSTEGLNLPPQSLELFARRVDGPAQFALWQFDGTGGLSVTFQSRDGLDETDRLRLATGAHQHHNVGLSKPGLTTVWLQVRATVGGTNAWSPETPVLFAVDPLPKEPVRLGIGPGPSEERWRLSISGTPGQAVTLEESIDLIHWTQRPALTNGFQPIQIPVASTQDSPARFFRVHSP
jgi:hypothetical protein